MIDVQKSLNECERLAECDPNNYCYEEHEEAFDSCYNLVPEEATDDTPDCPPDDSFDCVGGGTIGDHLVCDSYEDCADGSDEAGCLF